MPSNKMFANEIKNKEAKKSKTILVYTVKKKAATNFAKCKCHQFAIYFYKYILVNITVICCTRDCF